MHSKCGHAVQHVQEQPAAAKMLTFGLFEVMKLASSPTVLHCLFALKLDVGCILQCFTFCFACWYFLLFVYKNFQLGFVLLSLVWAYSKPAASLCKL